jgi:hypothetical protein
VNLVQLLFNVKEAVLSYCCTHNAIVYRNSPTCRDTQINFGKN